MDAYSRACAVTHEHSLPALEASHIQPYAEDGPHDVRNGVLLCADLHRLFDQGYVTITPEHRLEVSPRLKEDYQNGRSYYPLHGVKISVPDAAEDSPSTEFLAGTTSGCIAPHSRARCQYAAA
jgi:putative restriction endonuclease